MTANETYFADAEIEFAPGMPRVPVGRRTSWTATELLSHQFAPIRYAIPGLIAEGLNLFVGAPKLGKSWFAMNIGAAIAYGGVALDRIRVEQGEVLYLALEDPPRRLQSRLERVLAGEPAPAGLFFETEWPALVNGGCAQLAAWLTEHPGCRLVVVDVFARVRGAGDGNTNRYESDYLAMSELKGVADAHSVAILVVHHTRKASADDYIDVVSGAQGLAGAADAVLVLTSARGSADAKLELTGRDVEEREYAMSFDAAGGAWKLLDGAAADYELGETRRRILAYVREHEGAKPKTIADALALEHATVKQTVVRMVSDDQLSSDGKGGYTPYYLSLRSPLSPESDAGDRSDRVSGASELDLGTARYDDIRRAADEGRL